MLLPAPRCRLATQTVVLSALLLLPGQLRGQAALVADLGDTIQTTLENYYLDHSPGVELDGKLFFFNDDGVHGRELWRSDGSAPGTRMIVDLCPGACGSVGPSDRRQIGVLGGEVLFAGNDGVHGLELWASDGQGTAVRPVADVRLGLLSSNPGSLVVAGDRLFFTADDGIHGRELFVTDGTTGGTRLVGDLSIDPYGTGVGPAVDFLGDLVFGGQARDLHGLWRSDGTAEGTIRLAPLLSFSFSFDETAAFTLFGDRLLFVAADEEQNRSLWSSDGTAAGTVLVAEELESLRFAVGESQIFGLGTYSSDSPELWRTDGTPEGTWPIPMPDSSYVLAWSNSMAVVGDRLIFAATDEEAGLEPWVSDGTSAERIVDLDQGPTDSVQCSPYESFRFNTPLFAATGARVLFFANDGLHGCEPWRTDGTPEGTALVLDFSAGPATTEPDDFGAWEPPLRIGDTLFLATRNDDGRHLLRTDATESGTDYAGDLEILRSAFAPRNPTATLYGNPWIGRCFAAVRDGLLFSPSVESVGEEPWFATGSENGTALMADLFPGFFSGQPLFCKALNGRSLVQAAFFPELSYPILAFGEAPGEVETLASELGPVGLFSAAGLGDRLFLAPEYGLLATDGLASGTELIDPIGGSELLRLGERLLLANDSLYSTDGTSGSLAPLVEPPLVAPSTPRALAGIGDRAQFFASSPESGFELWTTDGTSGGTHLARDIRAGSSSSIQEWSLYDQGPFRASIAALDELALFAADDGSHGEELWRSDGTFEGTRMVADLINGTYPASPRELVRFGAHVYFVAESHGKGRELWRSDGTEAGTELVADLVKGIGSSLPENLHAAGSELYFSAWTPERGREAWRIRLDGSKNPQPVPLDEIAPGPLSSSPQIFREIGGTVFTVANDNLHGFELWTLREGDVVFSDDFEGTTTSLWGPLPN